MNLPDHLDELVRTALAGNLNEAARTRATALWLATKTIPDALVEDHLRAAAWIVGEPYAELLVDNSPGDVDLARLRRVVVEARRVLARGDGSQDLHDAVDAVAHLFPEEAP